MMSEEIRRREQSIHNSTQSSTLVIEARGRSKTRNSKDNREKSWGRSKTRKKIYKCDFCGKKGHIKKYCWTKKMDKLRERDKDQKKRKRNYYSCIGW
jgi:hypothetical protein